jgi:hypothetical protein
MPQHVLAVGAATMMAATLSLARQISTGEELNNNRLIGLFFAAAVGYGGRAGVLLLPRLDP